MKAFVIIYCLITQKNWWICTNIEHNNYVNVKQYYYMSLERIPIVFQNFQNLDLDIHPGSSHIDLVYVHVSAFWGAFSRNLVKRSVGFYQRRGSPNLKIGCILSKLLLKKTNLGKIGCFPIEKGILMVGCWEKIGIEKVKFSRFGRHISTCDFSERIPPPHIHTSIMNFGTIGLVEFKDKPNNLRGCNFEFEISLRKEVIMCVC